TAREAAQAAPLGRRRRNPRALSPSAPRFVKGGASSAALAPPARTSTCSVVVQREEVRLPDRVLVHPHDCRPVVAVAWLSEHDRIGLARLRRSLDVRRMPPGELVRIVG